MAKKYDETELYVMSIKTMITGTKEILTDDLPREALDARVGQLVLMALAESIDPTVLRQVLNDAVGRLLMGRELS